MTSSASHPSISSTRPLRALAAGALFAAALAGCSLLVDTDGLTATACTGAACTDASIVDAQADSTASADAASDACTANVQTDKANCGTCGHACGAGQSCSAAVCSAGCAGKTVYVSASIGNDKNDGCSESAPFATITAAVTAVQTAGAVGNTIEVCAGDYVESGITVEVPVALQGGYDCSSWTRRPTYGYPTFDAINQTTVETSMAAASSTTLTVTGMATTAATKIDGFTIKSPPSTINNSQSAGLILAQYTAALVTNNVILGATGTVSPVASLLIEFNAVPEVANNMVVGGSTSSTSVGVQIASASSPLIHENLIMTGTSTVGTALGLAVIKGLDLTGERAIRSNTISGGSGSGSGGKAPGTVGVEVSATAVDLIGNVILGGTTTCASGSCVGYGVYMDSQGFPAHIAGNRIVGGSVSGGSSQLVAGVQLLGTTNAWVVNNAIQASIAGPATESSVGIGLSFVMGTGIDVQQNTLYGSSASLSVQNANNVAVQNNIFLGRTDGTTSGINLNNCGPSGVSTVTAFTNNAFVDFGATLMQRFDPTACAETDLATLHAIEGSFAAGIASGNKRLAGSVSECGADSASACYVVADCSATQATASTCIDHVIGSWDNASQGALDLSDLTRNWALVSGAPCLLTQGGGTPLVDPFAGDAGAYDDSIDISAAARTAPVSLGAYENDVQCAN